jgi:hypothetical protein
MQTSSAPRGLFVATAAAQYRAFPILLASIVLGTTASGQRTGFPVKLENYLNSAGALSRN